MKDVIIVSTKKLRPFAVALKRGLAKYYDITAVNWIDKYFHDNEATITNKDVLIFVGSSSIIDPYIFNSKGEFEHHNCFWGWEGAVASIKVERDPENYAEFKEHRKNLSAAKKIYQGRAWKIGDNEKSTFDIFKFLLSRVFFPPMTFFPSLFIFPLHTKEQYEYAIGTFLALGMPDFQNSVDG